MAIQVRFKELGVVSPVRCCRDPVRGGKGSLDLHRKTTGSPARALTVQRMEEVKPRPRGEEQRGRRESTGPAVRMTLAPGVYLGPLSLHRIKGPDNLIPIERRPTCVAPPRERGRLVLLREQEMLEPRKGRATVGLEAGCGGKMFSTGT